MADDAAGMSGRRLTRLRTLGRGASGAVVSLFAADGELLAVKSAATGGAAQLRREGGILASLRSPYVLPCLGSRGAAGGEYQLLLEFAPGGSLADEVARNGGRLEEPAVRAYAGHVARGLAYLHGESMVHGDVKARNVVIGADGWAKLADFGCARRCPGPGQGPILGATPAFMDPEVARGEEQGPAADLWALGCTVIEMATGRAPWADMTGCGGADVISAVRRIGYTDAVPEAPERMSPDAKDFLDKCLRRPAGERWTAAQLLEHPFLLAPVEQLKARWVSPKSTLAAAMWEESDDADEDASLDDDRTAERMKALAASCSVLPDWESDEDGWIDVWSNSSQSEFTDSPAPEKTASSGDLWDKVLEEEAEIVAVQAQVFDQVAAPSEETANERLLLEAEIGVVQASVFDAALPSENDAGFRDEGLVGLLAEMDDGAGAFDTGRRVELVQNVGVALVDDQQHNVGVACVDQQQEDSRASSDSASDPALVVRVSDDICDEGIVKSSPMPVFLYTSFASVKLLLSRIHSLKICTSILYALRLVMLETAITDPEHVVSKIIRTRHGVSTFSRQETISSIMKTTCCIEISLLHAVIDRKTEGFFGRQLTNPAISPNHSVLSPNSKQQRRKKVRPAFGNC